MSKEMHKVQIYNAPRDSADGAICVQKIGRNDKCPCGSGLKVKNCCGKTKEYFYRKKSRTAKY